LIVGCCGRGGNHLNGIAENHPKKKVLIEACGAAKAVPLRTPWTPVQP
jgi:hypothetical protein